MVWASLSQLSPRTPVWRNLSFLLAVAINVLVLGCYVDDGNNVGGTCRHELFGWDVGVSVPTLIMVLGFFQLLTSFLICIFFYLNFGDLTARKNIQKVRSSMPALFSPRPFLPPSLPPSLASPP